MDQKTVEYIRDHVKEYLPPDYRDAAFDFSVLEEYEKARPLLFFWLSDPEKNVEYLKDKPHTTCGELAVTYRIQIPGLEEGKGSSAVTYEMMQNWGITKEQLHRDTARAESIRDSVYFYCMEDMIFSSEPSNLFKQEKAQDRWSMYVLTDRDREGGASVIAADGVLDRVGELLGTDFYVLPSSIHEVIILPDNGMMETKELEEIVKEINTAEVALQEQLSGKVQYYDRSSQTLGRKREKGVREQLADKKEQIQKKDVREKEKNTLQTGKREPSL